MKLLWTITKLLDQSTSPENLEFIDRAPFNQGNCRYRIFVSAGAAVSHKLRITPKDLPNYIKDSGAGTVDELCCSFTSTLEVWLKRLDSIEVVTTDLSSGVNPTVTIGSMSIECYVEE